MENEALLQVAGVAERCLVHTFLHQSPNSVVNWFELGLALDSVDCLADTDLKR